MRYATTLLVLLLCSSPSLAQKWGIEVEGGINTTGFAESQSYSKTRPQVSPVIGARGRITVRPNFFLDLSMRYNVVGYNRTNSSGVYDQTGLIYTIDGEEEYKFHKIGFGGGFGFNFGPDFDWLYTGMGYRMLYFPTGHYFSQVYQTDPGQQPVEIHYASYNPFNNPDLVKEASRIGHEFYFHIGVTVAPRLRIEFQYLLVRPVDWTVSTSGGSSSMYWYKGDDGSLSAYFKIR